MGNIFAIFSLCCTLSLFAQTENWGGKHISLSVTGKKAVMKYDCARSSSSNWVVKNGKVSATGTLYRHTGISRPPGMPPVKGLVAKYNAVITGDEMSLTVTTTNGSNKYKLKKGAQAQLTRCL